MFRNLTLGGKEKIEKIDDWVINRFNTTKNSSSKKWETEFRSVKGEGCKSIALNLHGYQTENHYVRILIGNIPKKSIEEFSKELGKHVPVNYSQNFPDELTLEPLNMYDEKKLENIIDAINRLNLQLNPLDFALLPKTEILKEFDFITTCVASECNFLYEHYFVKSR